MPLRRTSHKSEIRGRADCLYMCPIMTNDKCEHRDGRSCAIACRIAGLDRIQVVTDQACNVCRETTPPQAVNKVTNDLAAYALLRLGRKAEAMRIYNLTAPKVDHDRLRTISAGTGVGSQIWRLLSEIGVHHDPDCDCLSWAERLNEWGVAGCRLARAEIIEHLQDARKQYGWVRSIQAAARAAAQAARDLATGQRPWLNPMDPYGSLVDEAIRRAELPITDHRSPMTATHDLPPLPQEA